MLSSNYLKNNVCYIIMKVDQKWVEDNFDIISKIYNRLNKSQASSNRSVDLQKLKENADTVRYRAYYELARKQEKEKVNKSKTIGDKEERLRMDQIMEVNASHTKNAISNADEAIDLLDDQLRVKDQQIASYTKQMEAKDKQIQSLLEILNQKLSLSVS